MSDPDGREEPAAVYLFRMVPELGMPLECVETIVMLVSEFAKESVHDKQEGLDFPGRIRVFCQKKILDEANAERTTLRPYPAEQAMEHPPMILDFGTKINGGWGCFLVKRGSNVSDDASLSADHFIDLYLYKEG